jgi:hypothetical protein
MSSDMSGFNVGFLELHLRDVLGREIEDEVRITLDNFELNSLDTRVEINKFPAKLKLAAFPKGIWTVFIQPKTYRALNVGMFVNIPVGETIKEESTLFINAHLAKPIFPNVDTIFSSANWSELAALLDRSSFLGKTSKPLWDLLITAQPLLAAALLNLHARTQFVTLSSQRTVFSYFQQLTDIKQDRLFVIVDPALHADVITTKNTTDKIKNANGSLHTFPDPFKKFDQDISFKTPQRTGNLQLTFAKAPDGRVMIDTDVDDHQGIEHAFDVLHHAFTGDQTHPYDIHQILSYFYKMDLGYKLVAP